MEEGEDVAKSSCPLCPELTPKTHPQFGPAGFILTSMFCRNCSFLETGNWANGVKQERSFLGIQLIDTSWFSVMMDEERMERPIAASAAARALTKIAKMSPFNWWLSNRLERHSLIMLWLQKIVIFIQRYQAKLTHIRSNTKHI
jgi:hypothetical protein